MKFYVKGIVGVVALIFIDTRHIDMAPWYFIGTKNARIKQYAILLDRAHISLHVYETIKLLLLKPIDLGNHKRIVHCLHCRC